MTLSEWMSEQGLSNTHVAKELKVTVAAVSQWRLGKRVPRQNIIDAIKILTKNKVSPLSFRKVYEARKVGLDM